MTTLENLTKKLGLPDPTLAQQIAFAILCAREVCGDREWRKWAEQWLSGRDRSKQAARTAVVPESMRLQPRPVWSEDMVAWWAAPSQAARAAAAKNVEWTAWWASRAAKIAASRAYLDLPILACRAVEVME